MDSLVVSTVPADGLALSSARPSAARGMTKYWSCIQNQYVCAYWGVNVILNVNVTIILAWQSWKF